jgi:hypothetical protein
VLLIIETVLSLRWYRPWYESGLVLFSHTIEALRRDDFGVDIDRLENQSRSVLLGKLAFHPFSDRLAGFRPACFSLSLFNYSPILHGLLHIDEETRKVVVQGRLNWGSCALAITSVGFIASSGAASRIAIWILLVECVLYLVQVFHLWTVGLSISEQFGNGN